MDTLVDAFLLAYDARDGQRLGRCFIPDTSSFQLREFYDSYDSNNVSPQLTHNLFPRKWSSRISKGEQIAWIDLMVEFWEAVKELFKYQDGRGRSSAVKIFNAWKKMANVLMRGYTSSASSFPAWTLPCLYTSGKYLRIFAIKADNEVVSQGSTSFGYQDDISADFEKTANQEEAARIINRMFTLCLNDRSVHIRLLEWALADKALVPPLKILESGVFTTPPTFCSRPTLRFVQS